MTRLLCSNAFQPDHNPACEPCAADEEWLRDLEASHSSLDIEKAARIRKADAIRRSHHFMMLHVQSVARDALIEDWPVEHGTKLAQPGSPFHARAIGVLAGNGYDREWAAMMVAAWAYEIVEAKRDERKRERWRIKSERYAPINYRGTATDGATA